MIDSWFVKVFILWLIMIAGGMADFIDISRTKGMPLCSLEYSTSGIAWNCLNHQLIPDDYFPEAFITSYETGNVPVIEFYLNDSSGFTNIGPQIIVSGKMVPIEPGSNLCPGLLNLDHQKSLDLILLNTRGAVYRYFNLSLGIRPTMESYDFLPAGLNPDLTGYGTGDLNNDNYPDFILTPRYQPPILYLSNNDPISKNTPPLYPFRQRCDTRQVLIFDINRDQFKDIYFINFGRPNTFYLNLGNGQFLEQSCPLGIDLCAGSTGAAVADYNHDGWIDIFVTGYGVSRLFINREGVKFDDRTHSFRAGYTGYCNDATAGDFDNDGFIDLYLAIGNPDASPAKSNLLLKNHRGEYFESLSDLITGISESSTCATWVDYNNDGHLDLWVGNHGKNRMFENRDQTPNSIRLNLQAGLSGTHTNLPAYNGEFILLDPSGQELCRKQIIYDREPGNSLIFTGIEAGITYTIRIIHPWLSQPYEITGQAGRQLVLDGIY